MPDANAFAFLVPDWPAAPTVRALVTTRRPGGNSKAPYDSFNLGVHVGDDPAAVAANRALLRRHLPAEPCWLEQVHGIEVAMASSGVQTTPLRADAAVTRTPGAVCAVMTADCLPVLFCDEAGSIAAAAHAGWRGLAAGILEATLAAMAAPPARIMAWLGPAIGPAAFEVGNEVREAFLRLDPGAHAAFAARESRGKWLADLYALARRRLTQAGVSRIYGGGRCTFTETAHFYSYRRDGVTGRFASLIWLKDASSASPETSD
ncbi:MAG: peptidoglycan editing factor PgeF [Azoarcus sp.]|jgi:YfiH family protein|nr:peptidoglycan editing factor PgeF [Azoarcus sp.]